MTIIPDGDGGHAQIAGTEFAVYQVLGYYKMDEDAERIAEKYDIQVEEVEEAIRFAEEHPDEIYGDEQARIRNYGRVRFEQTFWSCPNCGEVLEPLGDPFVDENRDSVTWWDDPERWADVPAMICNGCRQRYRMAPERVE